MDNGSAGVWEITCIIAVIWGILWLVSKVCEAIMNFQVY